jgi:hypothetical protein
MMSAFRHIDSCRGVVLLRVVRVTHSCMTTLHAPSFSKAVLSEEIVLPVTIA